MLDGAKRSRMQSMIKVKRISHATFETPDVERQTDYYTGVVGLVPLAEGQATGCCLSAASATSASSCSAARRRSSPRSRFRSRRRTNCRRSPKRSAAKGSRPSIDSGVAARHRKAAPVFRTPRAPPSKFSTRRGRALRRQPAGRRRSDQARPHLLHDAGHPSASLNSTRRFSASASRTGRRISSASCVAAPTITPSTSRPARARACITWRSS